MDFLINLVKKIFEGLQKAFHWLKKRVFQPFNAWHQDHLLQSKLTVLGLFLVIPLYIFIDARVVAPMHSKYANTPLNQAETLGTNGSTQMSIVSRKYNSKENFMIVRLHASNDSETALDPDNLKFVVRAIGHRKVQVEKIALVNDDYILILRGLKPGYHAIQIKAIDKQVSSSNNANTTTDDDDDTSSSSSSSSSNSPTIGQQGAGPNYYNFIINEDDKFVDNQLQIKSKKEYVIEDLQDQISNLKEQIKQKNEGIDTAMRKDKADQDAIDNLNNQNKYSVDQDSNKTKIQQYYSDFQSQQDQITSMNQSIEKKQLQIKKYQEEISDIRSGKYHFDEE